MAGRHRSGYDSTIQIRLFSNGHILMMIGDIFKRMAPILRCYSSYIRHHGRAQGHLKEYQEGSIRFAGVWVIWGCFEMNEEREIMEREKMERENGERMGRKKCEKKM